MSDDIRVAIVGVGMHPFGRTPGRTGMQQGAYAAAKALEDAGAEWKDMQFGYGGSHSSGKADAVVNELGLTGIQFTNINTACATGGSSLLTACKEIKSGDSEIGLVVGFDKHERGAFNSQPSAHGLPEWYGETGMMLTTQFFASKLQRYMHDYNISPETLGRVAEKAYRNAEHNENAWRRTPIALDEIMNSQMVSDPLTKYMFCSPSEGGVALVVCNEKIAHKYTDKPIIVSAAAMRTRQYGAFEVFGTSVGLDYVPNASEVASKAAYEMAGVGPKDIDIAALQDTESGAEVMHMAENGFCEHGEQEHMLRNGETEIGGRLPINTDGGCMANGEPIGASGLRQIHEIVKQLRGEAGVRQVPNDPKLGYTHVYGAPGISAVTVLQR